MSSVRGTRVIGRDPSRAPSFRLTRWPLRDEPIPAVTSLALCLLVALVCGRLSGSIVMGLVAAIALALSLWRSWVPLTADVSPLGVTLTVLGRSRRIAWRDIGRVELGEREFTLWARAEPDQQAVGRRLDLPCGHCRDALAGFLSEFQPVPVDDHLALRAAEASAQAGPGDV